MFFRLAVIFRLRELERRDHLSDRATILTLFARFTDELCSGLLVVLMPTFRSRLGLSVQQVGWCFQALFTVGAVIESVSGSAIDLVQRRPLLAGGAAGWAAAVLLAAGAPSFGWLLAAFALAGAAYGPLTNTADVVLVEGHPGAAERIASRSTALDTVGALLAPGTVAVAGWMGLDQRVVLLAVGLGALGYALLLADSVMPSPSARPDGSSAVARASANLRAVLANRRARTWIGALLVLEAIDLPEAFEPVWLSDVVGVSQPLVAVHVAAGMLAGLVALVVLDRWLTRHDAVPVLAISALSTLALYPAWLLVPGYTAKVALVIARDAVKAPLWPIVHARALAEEPGRGGAVSALTALIGFLPMHAGFGWLAEQVGLTPSMLLTTATATVALLALLRSRHDDVRRTGTRPAG